MRVPIIQYPWILNGIREGYVRILDSSLEQGCDDLCCQIGDNAFYFCNDEMRRLGVDTFYKYPSWVAYHIWDTLRGEIKSEFPDEYTYYALYLAEKQIETEVVKNGV